MESIVSNATSFEADPGFGTLRRVPTSVRASGDKAGALVQRLKSRDPHALAELYGIYGRLVYVLIFRIVHDEAVAEDLVQESFLRAWRRSTQLSDSYVSAGPWLVAIARNCALDYRKSPYADAYAPMPEFQVASTEIESDILASERGRLLEDAFRRLSADQQQVIELAYYEGLTQTAIADKLKQPLGTIKSRARLALQKMRGVLAPSH